MGRRFAQNDLELGSDSFLDIIANIVGILIILIVMVGVRISKVPVHLPDEAEPPLPEVLANKPTSLQIDSFNLNVEEKKPETIPNKLTKSGFKGWTAVERPRPVRRPSPKLIRQIDQLKQELRHLDSDIVSQDSNVRKTVSLEQNLQEKIDSILHRNNAKATQLQDERQTLLALNSSVAEISTKFSQLGRELEREFRVQPPVETIEHRLTPISHDVQGKEIHFRLYNGRIAYVPIDELIDRLRIQISQKKNSLLKYRRHIGEVGPVEGFRMSYMMVRQRLSALEELKHGSGLVRITLTEWQLQPEPDLETESAAEALQPGSNFIRALRSADADASFTFWVYPDSFELFRKVQKYAHTVGFVVAARPLPFGVQIAGSPQGSRSAGQ
ncbi:MAG: hypothetical protein IID46_07785 [Planctomycetes bacterium]|nr:hypothetical protein [Planctomycetota bacterium]